MRRITAAVVAVLVASAVQAQAPSGFEVVAQPPVKLPDPKQPAAKQPDPKQPPAKQPDPKQPDPAGPNPVQRAFENPYARGTESGGLPPRSYNENFLGDNIGVFYRQSIVTGYDAVTRVVGVTQQVVGTDQRQVGTTPRVIGNTQTIVIGTNGQRTVTTTPVVVQDPVFTLVPIIQTTPVTATDLVPHRTVVRLPAASRYNGVQITDNDNPRPQDRVYFGYNFYSNVGASLNPGVGGSDVQRQMAGFELTTLDGDGSIGLRMPFIQQYGPAGLGTQSLGDLSVIIKYAFYNDLASGDLASAGVVVTAPTGGGGGTLLADGSNLPHSTLFQPWAGFVKMYDAGYVQGIANLIVPSDSRDPVIFGKSLGAGYFLYQNPNAPLVTAVVPRAEVHLRAPLSHRNPDGLVYVMDQVNLNGGLTVRFPGGAYLTSGVSVPVVGPRPWAVEAMSFLNVNF